MMSLTDLVSPQAVIPALKANSKKQALIEISEKAAGLSGIDSREVLDALIQRERLGSTGIGGGIAIPHGRLPSIARPSGLFARLGHPIDFNAIDERPVDIVFLLIAPEGAGADHLKALARVSRLLRDRSLVDKLRATDNAEALYALLIEPIQTQSAA